MDSLLCLEHGVEERVQRIQWLVERKLNASLLASLILAQADAIGSLCGALAERPVECIHEALG
tara:strand:+ start:60 stop:248 length:189 start_codon:yes stop_codon:yes gene_type:complete